jgi:beta-lactamase class A
VALLKQTNKLLNPEYVVEQQEGVMKEVQRYRQYTSYSTPRANNSRQPKHTPWKQVLILCALLVLAGGGYLATRPASDKTTPAASTQQKKKLATIKSTPVVPTTSPALNTMAQSINGVITQNSDIQWSVNLINLNNGQAEHYGTNDTFQAASTAKLIAAVDWLHQVEIGQQTMSETVGPDTAANDIDQMITVSNDPDWKAIEATLGYNNLQSYATGLGLVDYEAYNNSLTSGDIALILQKIWNGSVLNQADSQLILSYMKEANYRQYIVPAIPSEDTIYHKIGFYEDYLNDAAIVTHGNQAFAIVIFTNGNGLGNWPGRATLMQDITKAALQYYFNQ